jgi:hypothetical protein
VSAYGAVTGAACTLTAPEVAPARASDRAPEIAPLSSIVTALPCSS